MHGTIVGHRTQYHNARSYKIKSDQDWNTITRMKRHMKAIPTSTRMKKHVKATHISRRLPQK